MGKVVEFCGVTRLDIPPERVLRAALDAGMKSVVVVGFDADGNDYFAASMADAGEAHWHLARGQHALMRMVDEMEE